jgi:hypothetical protein
MGYTSEWWQENRKGVLEKRRERYATDPEYREKVRQAVRDRRAAKRGEPREVPTIPTNSGDVVGVMSRDVLSETGLSYNQLRNYHKFGWLPEPLITKPRALYTANQIGLIKKLGDFCRDNRNWMRQPKSPTGQVIRKQLDGLVSEIYKDWKN